MNAILTIWKKELKDTVRDRRTLLSSIILPMVLMPAIIIGMGQLTKAQFEKAQAQTVKVAVVNEVASDTLREAIQVIPKVERITLDGDPAAAVRDRTVDLVVVFPDDLSARIARRESVPLTVHQNSLNDRSVIALSRVAAAATTFNQQILAERLANADVPSDVQNGIVLAPSETATAQELGGFGLSFILPLFIIMWASVGGQYTAVDVSAGEKERKTLEALLLAPVRRLDIVFGKFLAVATAALLSVVIALTSLYLVFVFGGGDLFTSVSNGQAGVIQSTASSYDFALKPAAIATMFGISVLLAALFSAVNISLGIFAKSFKEAQSYIGPSYLVVILPVVAFNVTPGFVPSNGFFAIPVVNAVLLFKEVLVGTFNGLHMLLTAITLAATAVLAVLIASRIYNREGVLFKT